jgi:cyclopropane fatty-acyl-phospholipid synthase-like methyltransferase
MAQAKGFDDARAFWDERFAAPEYIFGRAPNRFLVSQAGWFGAGTRVLDVATGEGRNAVWLAQRGCHVTGIDISPNAIEKARRLALESRVEARFEVEDILTRDWVPDAFDAVITIFIQFAAPEERKAVFDGMRRTLRPGGVVVLQGYTPKQLEYRTGGPPRADHMYTEPMLREAFPGWEILHLAEHEDVLNEGTKHVGRSALIDLVARKPG